MMAVWRRENSSSIDEFGSNMMIILSAQTNRNVNVCSENNVESFGVNDGFCLVITVFGMIAFGTDVDRADERQLSDSFSGTFSGKNEDGGVEQRRG